MNTELLEKYLSGDATKEERIQVAEWVNISPENLKELMTLRRLYVATLLNSGNVKYSAKKHRIKFTRIVPIAASIAAILVCAVILHVVSKEDIGEKCVAVKEINVPVGQRVHTVLSDGTDVWLNSNSTLSFINDNADYRKVCLNGEALFDVAKDKSRPFIVETQRNSIKVLGTKFDVSSYDDSQFFTVKLYDGKVEVTDLSQNSLDVLVSRERLDFADGRYRKSSLSAFESETWLDGTYCFENASYRDILDKVQNYYGIKIYVTDQEMTNRKCTCKFRMEDGVDHLLDVLREIYPFRYEWNIDRTELIIYK